MEDLARARKRRDTQPNATAALEQVESLQQSLRTLMQDIQASEMYPGHLERTTQKLAGYIEDLHAVLNGLKEFRQ